MHHPGGFRQSCRTLRSKTPCVTVDAERVKLAVQTYVYGYPLLYNLTEIAKLSDRNNILRQVVPFDRFGAAREFRGPDAKFVMPNNERSPSSPRAT